MCGRPPGSARTQNAGTGTTGCSSCLKESLGIVFDVRWLPGSREQTEDNLYVLSVNTQDMVRYRRVAEIRRMFKAQEI